MSLISVIMPVLNNEKYFPGAVQSLLDQSFDNWELIIVEGYSTDRTGEIAEQYAAKDKRIKLIRSKEWIYESINLGIAASSGEYITVLNSDDKFTEDALAIAASYIEKYNVDLVMQPVGVVFCDNNQIIHADNIKDVEARIDHELIILDYNELKDKWVELLAAGLFNNQLNFYRKESIDGIRFRNDVYGGDYLFNIASLPRFHSAAYYPKCTYLFHTYDEKAGMNTSVGKYYGYEHAMFNDFYYDALQMFALNERLDSKALYYITQRRVMEFKGELNAYLFKSCTLSPEEKIQKIMQDAADIAKVFADRSITKEVDRLILSECHKIVSMHDGADFGKMTSVVKGINEYAKVKQGIVLDPDIQIVSDMVTDYLNPAHVGWSMLDDMPGVLNVDATSADGMIRVTGDRVFVQGVSDEDDVFFVLCPFGIGDTLFACSLMKEYMTKNNISKACMIIKQSHKTILDWYPDLGYIVVPEDDIVFLKDVSIRNRIWKLSNYLYGHFRVNNGQFQEIFYREEDLVTKYKKLVFGLDEKCELTRPLMPASDGFDAERFGVDDKTVILMPYASSVPLLPKEFFEIITKYLIGAGYNVATNVFKPGELPINNTKAICEDVATTIKLCERAYAVVSLRSGLCDALAFSKAKLFVINTGSVIYRMDSILRDGMVEKDCPDLSRLEQVTKDIFEFLFGH